MILPDAERATLYDRNYYTHSGPDMLAWSERRLRPDLVASLCYAFGATQRLASPVRADFADQVQWIKTELPAPRWPKFVFSVGCGRGEYEAALAELEVPFAAIDFSQSAVDLTRATIREWTGRNCDENVLTCSVEDACKIKFHAQPDTIILNESIEHFPRTEFLGAIGHFLIDHPLLIITNVAGFHPIVPQPGNFALNATHADSTWNHVTLVDDAYFDEIAALGRTVFRADSHLVVQL